LENIQFICVQDLQFLCIQCKASHSDHFSQVQEINAKDIFQELEMQSKFIEDKIYFLQLELQSITQQYQKKIADFN